MTETPTFEKTERGIMNDNNTAKPLLLLDIDGVLNAFPSHAGFRYTRHTIDGYRIHLHNEVRDMVSVLEEAFEIVWFTLWNHRASPAIGPHVGLAEADHLATSWERGWEAAAIAGYDDEAISRLMYAKTPLLPELMAEGRPWVWIDDAHGRADADYLVAAGLDPQTFRLVGTDPEVGLQWEDVELALDFARSLADGLGTGSTDSFVGAAADGLHFPGSVVGRVDAVSDEPMSDESTQTEAERLNSEFDELMARLDGVQGNSHACPSCGGAMVSIVYGYPSDELFERVDRGEVALGGCCPDPDAPQYQCRECSTRV